MRRMGCSRALRCRSHVDEDAAVLNLRCVCGNRIGFEARLAQSGAAMEFPVVPGAGDVVAIESAIAKRAADMVAGIRHHAEPAVLERQRKLAPTRRDAP